MDEQDTPRDGGMIIFGFILVMGMAAVGLFFYFGAPVRAHKVPTLSSCKSNLKVIGTCLEMYATDEPGGTYPANLAALTPNYFRTIPKCPEAGSDTYSASFKVSDEGTARVYCQGNHHPAIPPDYPRWESKQDLVDPPTVQVAD